MHAATLWQITLATDPTYSAPVFTLFTTTQLTAVPFTGLVLLPSTDYIVRAIYFDEMGNQGIGTSTPFTTLANGTIPVPVNTQWEECA